MPVKLLTEVTDSLAVGNMAKREVRRLQRRIAEQEARIAANDSIIQAQEKEIATNSKRIGAYDAFVSKQNQIIAELNHDMMNMNKYHRRGKKQFVVSLGAGYGYYFADQMKRAPNISIHVGKTLFRF